MKSLHDTFGFRLGPNALVLALGVLITSGHPLHASEPAQFLSSSAADSTGDQGGYLKYDPAKAVVRDEINSAMLDSRHCLNNLANILLAEGTKEGDSILFFMKNTCGREVATVVASSGLGTPQEVDGLLDTMTVDELDSVQEGR